ncbi:MAG: CvpA family protein [Bacteroidetes bacterium]|nr:CvpA family protein [Bacteroidota bacterium]
MILDVIGIILLIIFFVRGYMKGIIVAAFSMLSIVVGVIFSLKFSEKLSSYLLEKHIITSAWVQPLSYIIIFIGVVLLVRLAAKAIETSAHAVMLGWLNKLIGGMLYAFLIAMVWSSLLWIGAQMQLIKAETIAASKTYPFFSQLAPWVAHHIGSVIPVAKDVFHDLETFFTKVNEHVGTH